MNSVQKQTSAVGITPENFIQDFKQHLKNASLTEIELIDKKLKFLGLNFDPFTEEASQECQLIMDNLGLTLHLKNPYQSTNLLLRLLDIVEEQINQLKN